MLSSHQLSTSDHVHSLANRVLHSTAYNYFYFAMAALSLSALILTLVEGCPSAFTISIEVVINVLMIAEVSIRYLALKQLFLKSAWNIIDVVVSAVCLVSLIVQAVSSCSAASNSEAIVDTVLLLLRNAAQLLRLVAILRRNRRNLNHFPADVDFEALPTVALIPDELTSNLFAYDDDGDYF
ncbi:hypothetical protein BJ742DRAFT_56784 [Cladochytrium replicatum]|nr:hypothetical protein BJ742DRAFT_56784 [Cladochytrium replicatum]